MLGKFLRDTRGNFAMLLALAMVPIIGAIALAIDYTEMSRHRQATLNALDAANMATAWRFLSGDSETEVRQFAQNFFVANLGPVKPENVTLTVELPDQSEDGNVLKMSADLKYDPIFYGAFLALLNREGETNIKLYAENEVRLKNTLEVALVLDNSGSMTDKGSGSGKPRLALLKDAAKQLVDTLGKQGTLMKQVDKPVQFAIVPFASSVNVGPQHANASWMDTQGRSSIHHENFDWSTMPSNLRVEKVGNAFQKTGSGWGSQRNTYATRFSLYDDIKFRYCTRTNRNGTCAEYAERTAATWAGCVEMRPYPYNLDNTVPSISNPDTLFVPMFAPDESDREISRRIAYNNWWPDILTSTSTSLNRQQYMPKYFTPKVFGPSEQVRFPPKTGPDLSCGTTPITPLQDVTKSAGRTKIMNAIDEMIAEGATNVPEGIAWGWRVVSGSEPFIEGRPDVEKGNDKVIIVLTDGANTYYSPTTLAAPNGSTAIDDASNRSIYSNYGYAKTKRIFHGTTVNQNTYTNDNYTKAMNQHMQQVCRNAKAANVVVMTVALDLSTRKSDEAAQIALMEECASESRVRRGQKLFWNTTGAELSETFRRIADELSNLRFVG